jgi:hypothetical protein
LNADANALDGVGGIGSLGRSVGRGWVADTRMEEKRIFVAGPFSPTVQVSKLIRNSLLPGQGEMRYEFVKEELCDITVASTNDDIPLPILEGIRY